MLVTPGVLDRMRDNYMILEVWDKKASHKNDKVSEKTVNVILGVLDKEKLMDT